MTGNDDFIRQVEVFLDECEGTTLLPDRVRTAVRAGVPQTPQSRPIPGLARIEQMNGMLRIGIAAALVAVAVIVGVGMFGMARVGPAPDNTTDASNPARPSASAAATDSRLPNELRRGFLGPAKSIPGIEGADRGDLDLTPGILRFEIGDRAILTSTAGLDEEGNLHFTTTTPNECDEGDEGTYAWSLSPGGSVLTIAEGTDDCAARAAAVPGSYLRSECKTGDNWCLGDLEAGSYVSHYFEPRPEGEWAARHGAMRYTVPDGWSAYADWPAQYGLTPESEYADFSGGCYDCPGDRDYIGFLGNPTAAREDCLEEPRPDPVGTTAAELVEWLRQHEGIVAGEPATRSINGLEAITLEIEGAADWTGTCDPANPFISVPVFWREDAYHWSLRPGDRWELTLVDLGGGHTVAVVVDTADPADLDTFAQSAGPIIESLEFPER